MTKHHYLPAAFIGRFSNELTFPSRDRFVWVHRATQDRAFRQRASQVGLVKGLYDMSQQWHPDAIEEVWAGYESRLSPALDQLKSFPNADISLRTWLRVLVPFVAAKFVRGSEFGEIWNRNLSQTFADRADEIKANFGGDDAVNMARVLAFQRLLTPVMCATWVVFRRGLGRPLVCNELGLTPMIRMSTGTSGWAIPIDHGTILGIFPTSGRAIASWQEGSGWSSILEFEAGINTENFNANIARASSEFIFGPDNDVVIEASKHFNYPPVPRELLVRWPFSHRLMLVHEFDWYRAAGIVDRNPEDIGPADLEDFSGAEVWQEWTPIIMFPDNLPQFPTGLRIRGRYLFARMTPVKGFTDYPDMKH